MTSHGRYVTDAERFLFPLFEELGVEGVRDWLVVSGVDLDRAGRIAWFIRDHYLRAQDGLSPGTRVNYRRELRKLAELGRTPPGHNHRSRPDEPIMDVEPSTQRAA